MRVASLRHALARNIGVRKGVALQHGDGPEEIGQRSRGQQTADASPDYHRMFTDLFHDDAPGQRSVLESRW